MYRNKTARQKDFAVSPRADIPRSKFAMRQTRKQAFNASELVPIMVEEVLPGDVWQHRENIMARFATPIAPAVDDIDLETFYFFVPNRIIWPDWEEFITGQDDELLIPRIIPFSLTTNDVTINLNSVFDHMGLLPQDYAVSIQFNALPIFAYFTIWNEWFRDQNLQAEWDWSDTWTSALSNTITQGVTPWDQACLRANKRSDYFTRSLPWPQKGDPIELPLGTYAPVINDPATPTTAPTFVDQTSSLAYALSGDGAGLETTWTGNAGPVNLGSMRWGDPNLVADLSAATAATINAIRLAFQTQKLLERDARGGSRYIEQTLSHFGVRTPDFRVQRPEYLGGSKIPVNVNPVAATTDANSIDINVGTLAAEMHAGGSKKTFTYAATEHGYIIGVAVVRATPTYQQGTRRHWRRQTRLDYYFPVFSALGEQAVATQEIFQSANNAPTNATWGYQERHAEYRYTPNEITGVLRSTAAQPLDWWHYAEEFGAEPALNAAFITDKTQETLARSLASYPTAVWSAQIIMDILHENNVARMMPTYGVPGLVDHF